MGTYHIRYIESPQSTLESYTISTVHFPSIEVKGENKTK